MTLDSVRQLIADRNLNWTADETTVSDLSKTELASSHSGAVVTPARMAANKKAAAASSQMQALLDEESGATQPPDCFSWLDPANNEGIEIVSEPRHQSPNGNACNSCVAFSIVGAVEARMNLAVSQPAGNVRLSEGYLFFRGCGLPKGCGTCRTDGWSVGEGLEFAKTAGIPGLDAYPYDPTTTVPPDPKTALVTLSRWRALNPGEIKRSLVVRGPLVLEMNIYEDFKYYTAGVYENVSTTSIGKHAVALVGYCDNPAGQPGYWLCKNSWGTGWGTAADSSYAGGFFKVRYDTCGIASTFSVYEPSVQVQLSLAEATDAIDRLAAAVATDHALMECLQGYFQLGSDDAFCNTVASRDILQACLDIFAAYPSLEGPFVAKLG